MKIIEILKDIRFWFKLHFLFPFYDFILDHCNWIEMEGQLFRTEDAIYIRWHGSYNKDMSVVPKSSKLYSKFNEISHGSVFMCDYIWGIDGQLKNVRDISNVVTGVRFINSPKNLGGGMYFLKDKIDDYVNAIKEFDSQHTTVNN